MPVLKTLRNSLFLFAILPGLLFVSSCTKSTVKINQLKGNWKVSTLTSSLEIKSDQTISYNLPECDQGLGGTTGNKSFQNMELSDGKLSIVQGTVQTGSGEQSTSGEITISFNIQIHSTGSYKTEGTYNYVKTDPVNNTETTFSGSFETENKVWYFLENNEKNSAILFEDFPSYINLDQLALTGKLFSTFEDLRFDLSTGKKDKLDFSNDSRIFTEDIVTLPPVVTGGNTCIMTRKTETTQTRAFRMVWTR